MASNDQASSSGALIASPQTVLAVTAQKAEIIPTRPADMTDQQNTELETAAQNIIQMHADSPKDLRVTQSVGEIGSVSSFSATKKTQLIGVRLKPMLALAAESDAPIPKGLAEMRLKVKEIDPARMMSRLNQGWVGSVLSKVSSPMRNALEKISVQYDSVQEVIDGIVDGLLNAKNGLQADNTELAGMVNEVEVCLVNIRADAYQSELIFHGISQLPVPSDPVATRNRDAILQRLVSRIEDLRMLESVLLQLELETRSIFTDNGDLSDTIDRAATITRAILTVGMVNAVALAKQKATIGIVKQNREYNNALVLSLAEAAGKGAIAIAELMENPALSYEILEKGFTSLTGALDKADSIKRKRIESALKNLPRLQTMSADLEERGKRLTESGTPIPALGTGTETS